MTNINYDQIKTDPFLKIIWFYEKIAMRILTNKFKKLIQYLGLFLSFSLIPMVVIVGSIVDNPIYRIPILLGGYGFILFVSGCFLLGHYYIETKLKRKLEDIPTSKISTGAMGTHVEIKGRVVGNPDSLINAPITNAPSSFIVLFLEFFRTQILCSHDAFLIKDDSGGYAIVLIDDLLLVDDRNELDSLAHSQISIKNHFFTGWDLKVFPEVFSNFVQKHQDQFRWWKFDLMPNGVPDCWEWALKPGEDVYIMGYAEPFSSAPQPFHPMRASFEEKLDIFLSTTSNNHKNLAPDQKADSLRKSVKSSKGFIAGFSDTPASRDEFKSLAKQIKFVMRKAEGYPFFISKTREELRVFIKNKSSKDILNTGILVASLGVGGIILAVLSI